jgi:PilZ domain-containing protein
MTIENRQHPRYALDIDCTIMALGATLHARTRNLSRSGISCMVLEPLSPGTEVMFEMALTFGPNEFSEPIRLAATVMWCTRVVEAWQVGARFDPLTPPMGQLLGVFIQFLDGLD